WDSPPTSASPPESSNQINNNGGVLGNCNPVATNTTITVAKTTMTAVNGKPVSVRTFKLTNAMKQSLVASGCSQAVAVAAVASAIHTNGGANQQQSQHHSPDRLLTATAASCGSDPSICPVTSAITPAVVGGSSSSVMTPTAVQIVTNISELSHTSPTIAIMNPSHTLLQRKTNGSHQTAASSDSVQRHQQQNGIFKTPLAPNKSMATSTISPVSSTANNGHSQSQQNSSHRFFIVNNNGGMIGCESDMKTQCLNIKSKNSIRLTPILANTVVKQKQPSGNQRSNKRARTTLLANKEESNFEDSSVNGNSSRVNYIRIRQSNNNGKSNGVIRTVSNSLEMPLPYSPSSSDLSSFPIMMNEDGEDCESNAGDLFISTSSSGSTFGGNGYYANGGLPSTSSLSSSYPYSPSSSSSSDFSTNPHLHQQQQHTNTSNSAGRKSGRTRYETSLGQLTRKFISLLEKSADGSINLNDASDVLQVQKRRIYDITNVLEGVGLLHKTSKNNIQWRGGLSDYFSGRNPGDFDDQSSRYRNRKPPPLSLLFNENSNDSNSGYNNRSGCSSSSQSSSIDHRLSELENDENRLDHLLSVARENLNRVKLSSHLYASYNDLRQVPQFHDQTVIGIRPPLDTELQVSDPSEGLQIRLRNSRHQMIEVYLCPPNDEETSILDPTLANYEFDSSTLGGEPLQTTPTVTRRSSCSPTVNDIITVDSNPDDLVTETAIGQSACHSDMQSRGNTESGYHSYYGSGSIQTPVRRPMANTNRMETTLSNGSIHHVIQSPNKCSSVYDDNDSQIIKSEPSSSSDSYAHAFICHDDEFGPLGSRTYMTQTEDQIAKSSGSSPISRPSEQ
ncbi:transcription factor E2F3-like protein, partial [Euroglyphus maynei]